LLREISEGTRNDKRRNHGGMRGLSSTANRGKGDLVKTVVTSLKMKCQDVLTTAVMEKADLHWTRNSRGSRDWVPKGESRGKGKRKRSRNLRGIASNTNGKGEEPI